MMKRLWRNVCCIALFVCAFVCTLVGCGDDGDFNVNFVVDGNVEYTLTSGDEELPTPTKDGYTFRGWYFDNGSWENRFYPAHMSNLDVLGNVTVYARWEFGAAIGTTEAHFNGAEYYAENEYIMSVRNSITSLNLEGIVQVNDTSRWTLADANGNTISSVVSLEVGRNTFRVTVTSANNAHGNYTLHIDREPKYDVFLMDNITQTAEPARLTFNLNGATGIAPQSQIGVLTYPAVPQRNGYEFGGWYTTPDCSGSPFSFGSVLSQDTTLYAKWITVDSRAVGVLRMESNYARANLNGRNMRYYAFVPLTGGQITVYSSDCSFDTYGHLYNADFSELTSNDDGNGGLQFRYSYTVSAGQLYYAGIRAYGDGNSGQATIQIDGLSMPGSGNSSNIDAWRTVQIAYGDGFSLPVPERRGYAFTGWYSTPLGGVQYTDSNGNGKRTWNERETKILYAGWYSLCSNGHTLDDHCQCTVCYGIYHDYGVNTGCSICGDEQNLITLSFNLNGGYGSVPEPQHPGNVYYPSERPSRDGYAFGGWYATPDCSGTEYDFNAALTENKTLYAKWVPSLTVGGAGLSVDLNGHNVNYITFVATTSGNVTFYSSGDIDTYGYLYDADMTQLVSNDDGGEGTNFSITYNVTAGQTYYVGVRAYSSSRTGSTTVYAS